MAQRGGSFWRRMVFRVLFYVLGLFFVAMGVAISVNSNLGVSPVNSLPYIVSQISGVAMSLCVIGVFCFYILLQVFILRREFKPIQLTQIIFSTIFGYFVDLCKWIIGDASLSSYPGRIAMQLVSIVLISIGIALYVETDLVPMPMEGLSLSISRKSGIPFHNTKMMIDCIVVVVGIVLSFVFLHRLDGIREGTILAALLCGKCIGLLKKPLSPIVRRFCFPPQSPVAEV